MTWELYQKNKFLEPLEFSNGKNQEKVVKEVVDEIKKGQKIIFIKGVCGTGKSAIALHIAKEIGKTSIVVPGKNLQNQYKKDYEEDKFLKKKNSDKLKISIITGRKNHKCKFIEDRNNMLPQEKKEINSKLQDIFEGMREKLKSFHTGDLSADNLNIPCKIEIKEKNWNKIKEYLKENTKVNPKNFDKISDVRRISIAPVCPYWSPVFSEKRDMKIHGTEEKRKYMGINNNPCIFHKRKSGCKFYEQFNSYIDSDVIVFNSQKYKLESLLGRKPMTEIEIIDECDQFLDEFSNKKSINLEKLQTGLIYYKPETKKEEIEKVFKILEIIKKDPRIKKIIDERGILKLNETAVYDLLEMFSREDWLIEADEESYLYDVAETAREFENFMEESYITASRKENAIIIDVVTTNIAKKFKELLDKNKRFVLMSGTIHSSEVLQNIFGLKNFKIIEAEIKNQGEIEIIETGFEKDCKYSNLKSENVSREKYLKALDECIKIAKRPTLVHVNAFKDLPIRDEIKKYSLNNLVSSEEIKSMQEEDKEGKLTQEFKEGKKNILFSTKDSRGVDFPGEQCNSIVFTKYPNPNADDAFWKILKKTNPENYWEFYRDKAKRELLQRIYRGLRFKGDKVQVLSPDSRVLNFFKTEIKT